jgi:6-phosphogluconolactonase
MSPTRGKFLLSVGMDSAGITVYTIDQASGELKPIGHYPMGLERTGSRSSI